MPRQRPSTGSVRSVTSCPRTYSTTGIWSRRPADGPTPVCGPLRALAEKAPDLRIDEVLASGSPWPGIDVLEISGWPRLQEFVFSHRPSGTLLVTDLLFNEPTAHNLPTRLFLRAGGAYGRFAVSRFMKSMVAAKAAFADSLRPLLELPVERIVMAHGEVLETDARTRLRTLLSPFVRQPAIQGQ